jgi:hypothetical protein
MRAPSEPTSQTPPATLVGEHLHADLIPLNGRSIGGANFLLAVVDEKSGFLTLASLKHKSTACLCAAWDQLIAAFASQNHRIKKSLLTMNTPCSAPKHSSAIEVSN